MNLVANALAAFLLVLLLRRVANAYTSKPRGEGRFPVWAPLEMALMMEVVKRKGFGQHVLWVFPARLSKGPEWH